MSNSLNFSLKMVNEDKVKKDILMAIQKHMKKNFNKSTDKIKMEVKNQVYNAILQSSTMDSLQSGNLREEFGLESVNPDGIASAVSNIVKLKVESPRISGDKIVAKFTIEAAPSDLQTVTSGSEDGLQETEKGQSLPWLKWLLTLGDAVIIRSFEVKAGFPKRSRTGDKIMVKGRGWRVPPEHSGSEDNNFITRAIDSVLPQLQNDLTQLFISALGGRG
tara:strand:- start:2117 stop:2773 length:657 start_codon:yes stop_codon:yes gene_type:complete